MFILDINKVRIQKEQPGKQKKCGECAENAKAPPGTRPAQPFKNRVLLKSGKLLVKAGTNLRRRVKRT